MDEIDGTWMQATGIATPAGYQGSFTAVSCPSARNCEATGQFTDGAGTSHILTSVETAGAWSQATEIALPADWDGLSFALRLGRISCASIGNCVAVGQYPVANDNWEAMIANESNGTWGRFARVTLPNGADTQPAGNPEAELLGVSCASVGNCTAVGAYGGTTSWWYIALSESNGVWGQVTPIKGISGLGGEPPGDMNAVSCLSAGDCTAAGGSGVTLTETNGTWGAPAQVAKSPDTVGSWGFSGVSCTVVDCVAVGTYYANMIGSGSVSATSTNGTWSAAADVNPVLPGGSTVNPQLTEVSCPTAESCQAAGSGGASASALIVSESTVPASPHVCAFQAYGGSLWTVGAVGWKNWNLPMTAGTSPSVTRLSTGGFEVAVQTAGGTLSTVGDTGTRTDWNVGLTGGTSPAIVALPGGGYEVAFQSYQGQLWTVGNAGWTDWGVGMAPGTSPGLVALAKGGFEAAFNSYSGQLWTVGNAGWTDWGLGMAPTTSPSLAPANNGFEVAFQAYGGSLWTVGASGWTSWGLGLTPATSPAITPDGTTSSIEAFSAADGTLWTAERHGTGWPVGIAPGTSPSEA